MKIPDYLLKKTHIEMGVDFCGGNAFVPQHFLDNAQIGSAFEKMGGKGVAEGVRTDLLFDARYFSEPNHRSENGNTTQVFPGRIQQQKITKITVNLSRIPDIPPIMTDRIQRFFTNRNQPFLIVFANHFYETGLFVNL
jgi:hypothetical protein